VGFSLEVWSGFAHIQQGNTMKVSLCLVAALILCAPVAEAGDKEAMLEFMSNNADVILQLKESGSDPALLQALLNDYEALKSALNGQDPLSAYMAQSVTAGPPAPPAIPADPSGSTTTTTDHSNDVAVEIIDNESNTSTINVGGADTTLWDVDLTTNITHTWNSDLTITLTSPSNTTVVISANNGGSADNVFDGSLFDDQSLTPASDALYVDLVTASPLAPDGSLHAFRGEDPNGIWTLDCADGATGDVGEFTWSLSATTIDSIQETSTNHANNTSADIADNQSNTSTIDVAGADDYLCDANLVTNITHTWNSDLTITLTSPSNTTVVISSNNGGSADDVFNGTTFDGQQLQPPTTALYVDTVTAGPLTAEGALAAFVGENPNGTWTLDCADGATGDTGSFTWSLDLTTCEAAECFLVIGDLPGQASFVDLNHHFQTQVGPTIEDSYPVLMEQIPEFVLPTAQTKANITGLSSAVGRATGVRGTSGEASPAWMHDGQFVVQVLMWNPSVFPGLPEQYTAGLFVSVQPDGSVITEPFGDNLGGLQIWHEFGTNAEGQKVIRFPFLIPGI
jgi:subtilisin-like proprotein convertase family protein